MWCFVCDGARAPSQTSQLFSFGSCLGSDCGTPLKEHCCLFRQKQGVPVKSTWHHCTSTLFNKPHKLSVSSSVFLPSKTWHIHEILPSKKQGALWGLFHLWNVILFGDFSRVLLIFNGLCSPRKVYAVSIFFITLKHWIPKHGNSQNWQMNAAHTIAILFFLHSDILITNTECFFLKMKTTTCTHANTYLPQSTKLRRIYCNAARDVNHLISVWSWND